MYGPPSSFLTLTYSDENNPYSLRYRDYQAFMQRVRRKFGKARFFMCGEYGEDTFRPHYHAILFGIYFADRVLHQRGNSGFGLYSSRTLSELWPLGHALIGDLTFESAAYVGRYCVKKVTGGLAKEHYTRLVPSTGELIECQPEFCQMSRRPGIGFEWFKKYRTDVFNGERDGIVSYGGHESKAPRYYDKLLEKQFPALHEQVKQDRIINAAEFAADSTPERLAVREEVATARLRLKSRNLR